MAARYAPTRGTKVPEIKKGDTVVVLAGKDAGKRHTKPRQSAGRTDRMPKIQQGGIFDLAQPLPIGRVMLVCPNCSRPTRIAHATLESGRRVRVCRHCNQQLEVKA